MTITMTRGVAAALTVSWCLGAAPVRAADDEVALRLTLGGEPLSQFVHERIDARPGRPGSGAVPTSSRITAETAQPSSSGRRPRRSWWWSIGIGAAAAGFAGSALASHCRNEGGGRCSATVPVFAGLGALAGFLVAAR